VAATIDEVFAQPGVAAVVDAAGGRVVEARGLADDDVLEVVHHFNGTWSDLLDALLPVLADALAEPWTPGRWWACGGGDRVAVSRDGRTVAVAAAHGAPFLLAAAGDGTVGGVAVWPDAPS
jgi:hypothetical protein